MVQPSPRLLARLRFSTKQVAKGFYRGTGSGSMGAHTGKGKYIIDYRKTRHYNVPALESFKVGHCHSGLVCAMTDPELFLAHSVCYPRYRQVC